MRIATHQAPVWRDRANLVFHAFVDNDPEYREQLWGRRIEPGVVEICCIPFLLKDVALGDVVRVDDDLILEDVVERRGRVAFRFWFHEPDSALRTELATRLSSAGALAEWSSHRLLGVDAGEHRSAVEISGILQEFERRGVGVYETADTVGDARGRRRRSYPSEGAPE